MTEPRRADPRRAARAQVGDFLASRRARVSPEEAGLPSGIGRRRVPGLRREEVALLAGISVEYYARLERGNLGEVSAAVLEALTRVLRLDAVEAAHLHTLVRTAAGWPTRPGQHEPDAPRPALQRVLDLLAPAAAFVRNARLDVLATNRVARGLYAPLLASTPAGATPNLARFLFLDDGARAAYASWDDLADNAVGTLRAELARSPHDEALADLLGELRVAAPFRERWDSHEVRRYRSGRQGFLLPDGAVLELDYEALDVVADPGHTLLVYSAEPGTEAAGRLAGLATSDA